MCTDSEDSMSHQPQVFDAAISTVDTHKHTQTNQHELRQFHSLQLLFLMYNRFFYNPVLML